MEKKNLILRLSQVDAAYDTKKILENVNLDIYQDDFIGVIGPNGGGKTTLVKLILRLLQPVSGQITYYEQGIVTSHLSIGYLPQYNAIDKKFPITVYDVIASGLLGERGLFKMIFGWKDRVEETIQRMGLEGFEHRPIGQLSGGQIQRALLGRALISNPKLLILDEPNTYIDRGFEAQLYDLLTEVNKECAILLVSHDIGTVLQNVKSIACVSGDLHYHPDTEVSAEWLEQHFGCPIDVIGHGRIPHRVLQEH